MTKTFENHKGVVAEKYQITFDLIDKALTVFDHLYIDKKFEFTHAVNTTVKQTGIVRAALCSLTGYKGGKKSKATKESP